MEYLNLDYHIKRLLLTAMARYKTQQEQAKALGITSRTLINYCKKYELNYKKIKQK
jgi:transcriptional regulator with PAS, ATPase and Fis domain